MVKKSYQWGGGATLGEHSRHKHKILGAYIRRYLQERCRNPHSRCFRLAVVDGFAGGGRYKDGSPGSPVIFAETLLDTIHAINFERTVGGMPKVEVECLMILNDTDPEATRQLPGAVAPCIAKSREADSAVTLRVEYTQGEFEGMVNAFHTLVAGGRYQNVIYNLDQCGHSHVNRTTIARLVKSVRSVEIFLTFAVEALISFLSQKEPERTRKQLEPLGLRPGALEFTNALVSRDEWLGTAERVVFEHFRATAPFVTPFAINNPDGWRYWFMHFACHHRARQVFNNVLHDNSSALAHFGRAGLHMLSYNPAHKDGSLYLFNSGARDAARQQLPDDIARLVSEGGDTIGISKFYSSVYPEPSAHSDDIHNAILNSPDLDVLTPKGNPRRRAHTISSKDTLYRKAQRSFHLPGSTRPQKDKI
ncbi:MAG: three-Cys-motif partner protein TcmP [Rhodobacteraceae bacterium]|nr:three-Cys-motif partner protein TcmP [Paracoccaceae bacterium]